MKERGWSTDRNEVVNTTEIRNLRESKSIEQEEEYERGIEDDNEKIEDDSDDSDYEGSEL